MKVKRTNTAGFSLIELMVASTLATVMSLAVLSLYINQSGNLISESQRDSTAQEAYRAFDIISRLVRQAVASSINIKYGGVQNTNPDASPEIANDSIDVVFNLPSKQDIWPNSNSAISDNNAVRLKWDNKSTDASKDPSSYQIQISNTTSIKELDGLSMKAIAGSNDTSLARIINFDMWPLQGQSGLQGAVANNGIARNGYLLKITSRSALPDLQYINPDDKNGIYKHHRTYTVSGVVTPRN